MFLGFANFYQRFIQGFSWIAALFISMLKTLGSTKFKTRPGESGVGVGGSRAEQEESEFNGSRIDDSEVDGGEVGDNEVGKKV